MEQSTAKQIRLIRSVPASWALRKRDIPAGTTVYLTGGPASGDEFAVSTRKDLRGSFTVPSAYLYGDD